MAVIFEHTRLADTEPALYIKDLVVSLDKRSGYVIAEYSVKRLISHQSNATDDPDLPGEVKIRYGGADKVAQDFISTDEWQRGIIKWNAGKDLALINHGNQDVVLRFEDSDNVVKDYTFNIKLDLDPIEYHFRLLDGYLDDQSVEGGNEDSFLNFFYILDDLLNEQIIEPAINSGTPSCYCYYEVGSQITQTNRTFPYLNGVKFKDCTINFGDVATANRVRWKNITAIKMFFNFTPPEGVSKIDLNLNCTKVS